MTRTIMSDARIFIGEGPGGSMHPAAGDVYFDRDCASHWGERAWALGLAEARWIVALRRKALEELSTTPVKTYEQGVIDGRAAMKAEILAKLRDRS